MQLVRPLFGRDTKGYCGPLCEARIRTRFMPPSLVSTALQLCIEAIYCRHVPKCVPRHGAGRLNRDTRINIPVETRS